MKEGMIKDDKVKIIPLTSLGISQ